MGTKQCSRAKCENVLCGRYSKDYGYICNECIEELDKKMEFRPISIRNFMLTSKEDSLKRGEGAYNVFEEC